MVMIYPTYLNLKKQRFFCKACHSTFIARTPIVEKHCNISNHTKAKVLSKSTDAQSLTDISKNCTGSTTTVQRGITKEAKKYKHHHNKIPKHVSFDEFKNSAG